MHDSFGCFDHEVGSEYRQMLPNDDGLHFLQPLHQHRDQSGFAVLASLVAFLVATGRPRAVAVDNHRQIVQRA